MINASLLLDQGIGLTRGDPRLRTSDTSLSSKSAVIAETVALPVPDLYRHACHRWMAQIKASGWHSRRVKIQQAAYLSRSAVAILETSVSMMPVYGVPQLEGTQIKGLMRRYLSASSYQVVRTLIEAGSLALTLDDKMITPDDAEEFVTLLLGRDTPDAHQNPSAGLVSIHNAWWIPPNGPGGPFVSEIVNPHNSDYLMSQGKNGPKDYQQPIPALQIAVWGKFLLCVESRIIDDDPESGLGAWALAIAEKTLIEYGIGARRHVNYGKVSAAT